MPESTELRPATGQQVLRPAHCACQRPPLSKMKCPSCDSHRVRRSRFRPEDGLWRSIFYTAYRCRNCGRRFQYLTRGLLLGAVGVAALGLTFGLGLLIGAIRDSSSPEQQPPEQAPLIAPPAAVAEPAANGALPGGQSLLRSGEAMALAQRAEDGDAKAQFQLGVAYFKGETVERDPPQALKWIEKSAAQGLADAQYMLGAMHHAGRGALQSFPLAYKWFELAAQQNHADAQYSLGVMYRNGQGVAIDKATAYIWFNLAAAQGHERAREARNSVLPSLTPDQVLAAQKAAQEWRPVSAAKQ
jgi:hypothetical protein